MKTIPLTDEQIRVALWAIEKEHAEQARNMRRIKDKQAFSKQSMEAVEAFVDTLATVIAKLKGAA